MAEPVESSPADVPRQTLEVDIACVGFGPAMGGFLTTLGDRVVATNEDGTPQVESKAMPGMPLQVICYERADDIGFGVSGVVTKARGIRDSYPDLDPTQIPMAAAVKREEVLYLLDPHGASRRSWTLRLADRMVRATRWMLPYEHHAVRLPYTPSFLHKEGGLVMSLGQFNQWVGAQVMGTGSAQIWPGTPVSEPLIEDGDVRGVRLLDQGVEKDGSPGPMFMPGMDVRAALTVVGDGPVGAIGRQIDQHFGMPEGRHRREWAIGMKMVVDLRDDVDIEPGTVFHTFGYPEPEIFGFFYVHPDRVASVGIFVPSWFDSPVRTSYRYLQHFMMHPYLWRYLEGGKLRSWGAKSIEESGKQGEPHLVGNGYSRIGEGSGSTNVLTGSGVDEAWTTGVHLAEGVIELLDVGEPFTRENLEKSYVRRRRESWVESEGRVAEKARSGFQREVVTGLLGMTLAGMSRGKLAIPGEPMRPHDRIPGLDEYYKGKISSDEIERIRKDCASREASLHDALMDRCGWPPVPLDGELIVSHQDALLLGGKVQAPPGYADHVEFLYPHLCETCGTKICVEVCSGEAIGAPADEGVPTFDREKCVHCGACLWNCATANPDDPERTNIEFRAGTGGLHSAEN